MEYAVLGKTGLKVSRLGFGAMRLPMNGGKVDRELAIPMLHKAFEAGVNYVDTAQRYCNSDSEIVVGEALKGWRDKVILSTKNNYFGDDEKEWWEGLETSLKKLDVDYIDIYNHHGIDWEKNYLGVIKPKLGKLMEKAKDQGLIRHICVSFHDTNDALRKVIDTGYPESITLQYNILNRQLEDGIAYAKENNVGVVVMGPVGGGRLGSSSEVLQTVVPEISRMPELALRFVLANEGVSLALSGMSTIEHVDENTAVASDSSPLAASDMATLEEQLERLKKMADLYCTGCEYCKPCPGGVNISRVFNMYNTARVYGLLAEGREKYRKWHEKDPPNEKNRTAAACTECGACLPKCPQGIPIPDQLREAHEWLMTRSKK